MKATSRKARRSDIPLESKPVYRGKQARSGNSLALRFERSLFHSHPEFNGEVEAHVIGPGRMLVVAEPRRERRRSHEDPVLASFLSFLAEDMGRSPQQLVPVESSLRERIRTLLDGVSSAPDEDLGDEALI